MKPRELRNTPVIFYTHGIEPDPAPFEGTVRKLGFANWLRKGMCDIAVFLESGEGGLYPMRMSDEVPFREGHTYRMRRYLYWESVALELIEEVNHKNKE